MRHATRPLTWLLLLASCFNDSGGDDGSSTTGAASTTGSALADGTSSGPGTSSEDPTTTDATTGPATSTTTTTTTTGDLDEPSCAAYCDIYAGACVDFNAYDNRATCLLQCAQWPVGLANATEGDSLGCRQYHVTVAGTTDPDVHCPHAGPSGAGVCVAPDAPTCADYCATFSANCKDFPAYLDDADCNAQCALWYPGVQDATQGDSVGCRLYHAGVALGDAPTHCPHAGPGGADVCVVQ